MYIFSIHTCISSAYIYVWSSLLMAHPHPEIQMIVIDSRVITQGSLSILCELEVPCVVSINA